jgi:hypothetical protein
MIFIEKKRNLGWGRTWKLFDFNYMIKYVIFKIFGARLIKNYLLILIIIKKNDKKEHSEGLSSVFIFTFNQFRSYFN